MTGRFAAKGGVRLIANWLVLGVITWTAVAYARRTPTALPAYAVPREFSAGRATGHVQRLTGQPHATGSVGNVLTRGYLLGELSVLGLQPTLQTTTGIGTRYPVAGHVTNVVARLPGTRPNGKAVLLMAHYDAVPAAPGAADDASGVATLLEALRALRSGPQLRNDVIALFTDGEEAGLLGAAAFVREHPWAKDVAVILNFEARGTHGPSLMFETGPGNLDVVRVLRRVPGVHATSLSTAVYRRLPNDTDLSELAVLGLPALNFAFIDGVGRYHTAQDDVAHLDANSVQHHGDQAMALTRAFGNSELPRPRTSDAVFFDVPLLGLVVYPESWAIPLALLASVLVIGAAYRNRAADGHVVDLAGGALMTIAAAVLGAAMGYALGLGLQRLHAALRSGAPEASGTYAIAMVLATTATTAAAFSLFARRPRRGIHGGALVAWAVLALAMAFAAPGASFLFLWPVIAVAGASMVKGTGVGATIAMWLGACGAVFIIVPIVAVMAFVALGVSQVGGTLVGLFTALTLALLAPLVELEDARRSWLTAALAATGAGVLLAVGAATVRTSTDHPGGASLVYAMDADSAGAWLTGYANNAASRGALRHFIAEVRGATEASRAGAPPEWLRRDFARAGVAAVPHADVARLETAVMSDSTRGPERALTMRIRPGRGVSSVTMSVETGEVLRATVDGRPVTTDRYRARSPRWSLSYVAPPDSGFILGLVMPASSRTVIDMTTLSQGIPPLQLPPRPRGIVPVQGGNTTMVRYRIPL